MTNDAPASDPGLSAVLAHYGSRAKIAAALGISRPAVAQWRRIPPRRAYALSRLTGIPIETLLGESGAADAAAAA